MLQDPWAGLMQQFQQHAALKQPEPVVHDPAPSSHAAPAQSMSDVFEAAQEVVVPVLAQTAVPDLPNALLGDPVGTWGIKVAQAAIK